MADYPVERTYVEPHHNLVTLTHVMYALHAVSALTGVLTPALIITAFLFGWPSIIAVIMNYVKRDEARGTYLESHLSWQLRTFWFAVLWLVIIGILFITFVGIVIAIPLAFGVGVWVIYRIVRGWMALAGRKPMPLVR